VTCAAKTVDPTGDPSVAWGISFLDPFSPCAPLLTTAKLCGMGEVGAQFATQTPNNGQTDVKTIYGRALGGCKAAQTYYAIPGGARSAAVKSIGCKDCTKGLEKVCLGSVAA
jgi:hypothetical protein